MTQKLQNAGNETDQATQNSSSISQENSFNNAINGGLINQEYGSGSNQKVNADTKSRKSVHFFTATPTIVIVASPDRGHTTYNSNNAS